MDAASFKGAWESAGDQLCRYPAEAVSASKLPNDVKHFLTVAGLPAEAAPFLTFGPDTLDWLDQLDDSASLYPLGSDGSGDPIVVDMHGVVWLIDHDQPTHRSLMNSSLPALAQCLIAYRTLVEEVIASEGDDAYLDGRIPKHMTDAFSESVRAIDPAAATSETFWGGELSRLNTGVA